MEIYKHLHQPPPPLSHCWGLALISPVTFLSFLSLPVEGSGSIPPPPGGTWAPYWPDYFTLVILNLMTLYYTEERRWSHHVQGGPERSRLTAVVTLQFLNHTFSYYNSNPISSFFDFSVDNVLASFLHPSQGVANDALYSQTWSCVSYASPPWPHTALMLLICRLAAMYILQTLQ